MSAMILAFPETWPNRAAPCRANGPKPPALLASDLSRKFTDHFLPIVQASIDLLEADKHDFEDRCQRMLDQDGTAMIDELCEEMQIVGRQMQILVDGLELTRARLRTAMAKLAKEHLDAC